MRKIKFKFKEYDNTKLKNVYSEIEIKYNQEYKCLYSVNGGGNGMLEIENSNVIINFDLETKRVCGIGGYIGDLDLIPKVSFRIINSQKSGLLSVNADENFINGVAYVFSFNQDVKYDSKHRILIFGEFNDKYATYQILKNVYIQLDEYLRCILIMLN